VCACVHRYMCIHGWINGYKDGWIDVGIFIYMRTHVCHFGIHGAVREKKNYVYAHMCTYVYTYKFRYGCLIFWNAFMCVVSLCAWGVLSSRVWVGLLCVCVNGCVCVCSRVCRCLAAHGSRIVSPSNHVPSVLALELSQVMHSRVRHN